MISFGFVSRAIRSISSYVEQLVVAPDAVGHDLEPFAGHVDRRAVRQMPAGGEVEAHEGVAGLEQRQEHRLVHLAAGIRLHVGELCAEQLLRPLDRQRLGDVDELAAAVVALARIALGVFVGHHRALRLEHGARHDVFRGDQLDLVALAAELVGDRIGDLGVRFGERRGKEAAGRGMACGRARLATFGDTGREGSARHAALQQPRRAIPQRANLAKRTARGSCFPLNFSRNATGPRKRAGNSKPDPGSDKRYQNGGKVSTNRARVKMSAATLMIAHVHRFRAPKQRQPVPGHDPNDERHRGLAGKRANRIIEIQ